MTTTILGASLATTIGPTASRVSRLNSGVPAATDADVVILAVDIHTKSRGVEWAMQTFTGSVFYVPGNHEYYGGHLTHTLAKMRTAAHKRVQVMNMHESMIGCVRFLGCALWTNYAATGDAHQASWHARTCMNDFRYIRTEAFRRIVPNDLVQVSIKACSWLRSKLEEPFHGKTVVITHHAPSLLSLKDSPDAGTLLDAAYAVDCEDLMGGERVALWVHGHSHFAVDYEIRGTRVVCNPRGYTYEETGFDPNLVLTI